MKNDAIEVAYNIKGGDHPSRPGRVETTTRKKCCICGGAIEQKFHDGVMYWDKGENAEPLVEGGRCCKECNLNFVVPVRMGLL